VVLPVQLGPGTGALEHHLRAAHAFDLPFIFGNFGPSLFSNAVNSTANRPAAWPFRLRMMSSIGAFARNGDQQRRHRGGLAGLASRLVFDATLAQPVISVQ